MKRLFFTVGFLVLLVVFSNVDPESNINIVNASTEQISGAAPNVVFSEEFLKEMSEPTNCKCPPEGEFAEKLYMLNEMGRLRWVLDCKHMGCMWSGVKCFCCALTKCSSYTTCPYCGTAVQWECGMCA